MDSTTAHNSSLGNLKDISGAVADAALEFMYKHWKSEENNQTAISNATKLVGMFPKESSCDLHSVGIAMLEFIHLKHLFSIFKKPSQELLNATCEHLNTKIKAETNNAFQNTNPELLHYLESLLHADFLPHNLQFWLKEVCTSSSS